MHKAPIYTRPKIAMCPIHYIVLRCAPYTTLYCDVSRTLHCIAMCLVHCIVADTPFRWDVPCSGAELGHICKSTGC